MNAEARESRKEARHVEQRERIKAAALNVLAKGVADFTMKKVAFEAKCSKPRVYYYFLNVEELLVELAIDGVRTELSIIENVVDKGPAEVFKARALYYLGCPLRYQIAHVLAPRARLAEVLGELEAGRRFAELRKGVMGVALDLALGVSATHEADPNTTLVRVAGYMSEIEMLMAEEAR